MFVNIGLLALTGCCIQIAFMLAEHREQYVKAVCMKGTASLEFVAIGIAAGAGAADQSFARMIVAGLCLGAVGDVLLNLRFVFPKNGQKIFLAGIAAFLAGHILYLAAIIPKCSTLLPCVAVGIVVAGAVLAYIFKTMTVKPSFKAFGVLYLGAIIIMTSVAIGNLIHAPTAENLVYALGAVLFTLSDIVMIFNTFNGTTKFSLRITNLSLYYLGQLLIAGSLLFC